MALISKTMCYSYLLQQLQSLLQIERDPIANMSNFAAAVYHGLPNINWVGFYLLKENTLLLGPFQGKPACVRIELGKGVCGTAAARKETIRVPDVHTFAGHIACDSASQSEMVIPVFKNTSLWGVLDLDSPSLERFDCIDQENLEKAVRIFEENTNL